MRFTAAVALFAASVSAITVTSTQEITITSCAPTVTDCPAGKPSHTPIVNATIPWTTSTIYTTSLSTSSDKVVTVIIPISTTVCPVTETPVVKTSSLYTSVKPTSSVKVPVGTGSPVKPSSSTGGWYASTGSPVKPTSSLPAYTGAASHAQGGMFVAGLGAFAAFLL